MRIDLKNLSTEQLELSLPGEAGQERSLVLRDVRDLRGLLRRDSERMSLRNLGAESATLAGMDWRTPSVHVLASLPVTLSKLLAGADVYFGNANADGNADTAPGVHAAHLSADAVATESLSVALKERRVSGQLGIRELALSTRRPHWQAALASLEMNAVQTVIAGLLCRVAKVAISQLLATTNAGEEADATDATDTAASLAVRAQCEAAELGPIQATRRGLSASVAAVALPAGFTLAEGVLEVPVLEVSGIELPDTALSELRSSADQAPSSPAALRQDPAEDASAMSLAQLFDVTQLDRLSGQVDVDVTVAVSLAVLGNRVGTHEFRVAVADGIFNYRQLERGLSALEDSVIDFETRDATLVLERDIPLIGMRKDLVRWSLPTEQDVFLAQQKSVRIRTLLTPEIPGRQSDADAGDTDAGESASAENLSTADKQGPVRRLSVENLCVTLSASRQDGTQPAAAGAITDLEMRDVQLTGELHLFDERDGALQMTAESLSLQIRDLAVGDMRLLGARVMVEQVKHVRVCCHGATVLSAAVELGRLRVEGLRLALPKRT